MAGKQRAFKGYIRLWFSSLICLRIARIPYITGRKNTLRYGTEEIFHGAKTLISTCFNRSMLIMNLMSVHMLAVAGVSCRGALPMFLGAFTVA
jgi:hypothetical protein